MSPIDTERIRAAAGILDTVERYVTLRKIGTAHMGLCPFHREKNPSFRVDPVKQRWKCFGCGLGGDVFDFVSRIEGVGFTEARRGLAQLAGISVDEHPQSQEQRTAWAAERRAIERDLPAARLWRWTALVLGEELLDTLKSGLEDPKAARMVEIGEIAEWTRRIDRWRTMDDSSLVATYQDWRARHPEETGAMVQTAALYATADSRATRRFVAAIAGQQAIAA